jgi:hypothetical protein
MEICFDWFINLFLHTVCLFFIKKGVGTSQIKRVIFSDLFDDND